MAAALVQTVHKVRTAVVTPTTTTTITVPTVAEGSLLTLALAWFDGTGQTVSVADDQGNTWAPATIQSGDANSHVQQFSAPNAVAGTTVITLTFTNVGGTLDADVEGDAQEWSGMALASVVDKDLGASGTGTSMAIDYGTLAQADEVLIMIGSHTGADATFAPDTTDGFTQISENEDNDSGQTYHAQYKIHAGSTTGPVANITCGASRDWFASGVSFKTAAAAGGTILPQMVQHYYGGGA